jgi:hypothetical protein
MSSASLDQAKKFLIRRILDQAKQEDVPLSELEVRMLGFTEKSELERAARFEREVNDEQYETKIAGLMKRAYQRDKGRGESEAWDRALADLGEEDMYLLVMVKQAGIEDSTPFPFLTEWRFYWGLAPTLILVAAGIVLAFTPIGAKLVPNGFIRFALLLLFLMLPFVIGRNSRKKIE